MDLEKLVNELGLPEGSTFEDAMTAIKALMAKASSADDGTAALNAANTALVAANTELKELKVVALKGKVETALNTAVTEGRITEEQKPAFEALLNSNFEAGEAALNALPGSTNTKAALNSSSAIGGVTKTAANGAAPGAAPEVEDRTAAFNSYMNSHGLDKNNQAHIDQAWQAVRG